MKATFTKLKNGDWGVRVEGEVTEGQSIVVTKKDGSTDVKTIQKVLWNKDGISLCSIEQIKTKYYNGCSCPQDCCRPRCSCPSYCNCRGGNIFDC